MDLPGQTTIIKEFSCSGIGLHTGKYVVMGIKPAAEEAGIVFIRTDLPGDNLIKASYINVDNTELCTRLSNRNGASVSTTEHILAALWGCGVTNAIIELNGPEVPILDGSAGEFVRMIEGSGIVKQQAAIKLLEVKQSITVSEGESRLSLTPADKFSIDIEVDYGHTLIGKQRLFFDGANFKDIWSARTFCFFKDIPGMQSAGMALGGSLDNAVIIGDEKILNPEGLRCADEIVRHKLLDMLGDFSLGGGYIMGHIKAERPGHTLNRQLIEALCVQQYAGAGPTEGVNLPRR